MENQRFGGNMVFQLFLGGILIGVNVFIHALALDAIIHTIRRDAGLKKMLPVLWKPALSAVVVLAVMCSHIIQIWMWAFVYLELEGVPLTDMNTALYFSTTTMTTLGYGDIVLPAPWNMLSAIESANGILVFGWSTAFIFEIISQIYRREAKAF
jgi:hypothetical protein